MKNKMAIDKILVVILILSVFEVVFFILCKSGIFEMNIPDLHKNSYIVVDQYSYVKEMINDMSLAYIMSYIFYVIVLIPENKRQQSINKYVSIYLTNILYLLVDIIQISNKFIDTGEKKLVNSPKFVSVLHKESGKVQFLSYREHFIKFYLHFKDEYQHMSHYIAFIDDDLRECLYEIVTSDFLQIIKDMLIDNNSKEFDEIYEENFNIATIEELTGRLKQLF